MRYLGLLTSLCLAGLGTAHLDYVHGELFNRQYVPALEARKLGPSGPYNRNQVLRRRGWFSRAGPSMNQKPQSRPDTRARPEEQQVELANTKDQAKSKPKAGYVPESPWANSAPLGSPSSKPPTDKPSVPLHRANEKLGPGPYRIPDLPNGRVPPRSPFADLPPLPSRREGPVDREQGSVSPLHQARAKFGSPPHGP